MRRIINNFTTDIKLGPDHPEIASGGPAYSVGFCSNVEHFNLFLFVRPLWSKLLMTHLYSLCLIPTCSTCSECLFLGGTNFLPLTHYDTLQLLMVLCLNFLIKQQLTSQRPGNLLRQSQVGSWSWNETHLKIRMTHSGGTCQRCAKRTCPTRITTKDE